VSAAELSEPLSFAAFRETRNWPDDLICPDQLVGEVFAHAIARKREHEKLLAAWGNQTSERSSRAGESYLKQAVQVRPRKASEPLGGASCR